MISKAITKQIINEELDYFLRTMESVNGITLGEYQGEIRISFDDEHANDLVITAKYESKYQNQDITQDQSQKPTAKELGRMLFEIHTHMRHEEDEDDSIVYKEKDVVELLEKLGFEKADFSYP